MGKLGLFFQKFKVFVPLQVTQPFVIRLTFPITLAPFSMITECPLHVVADILLVSCDPSQKATQNQQFTVNPCSLKFKNSS